TNRNIYKKRIIRIRKGIIMLKEYLKKEEIIRIIKYIISSGSSFVLDLGLFSLFHALLLKTNQKETLIIFIATLLARILSSLYNYFINSRIVFQNKNKKAIIGYFILVIIQMIVSATLVSIVKKLLPANVTIIKFVIDVMIFIVNYIVQKKVIFKERKEVS
ncbi:MAG: GtrA family protein, partial [Bacilli bacterium]|nr:GtrA family protein [Bacilli bacterium]